LTSLKDHVGRFLFCQILQTVNLQALQERDIARDWHCKETFITLANVLDICPRLPPRYINSLYYVCVIFICILSHTYTFPHSTYESSSSLSVFFNLTSILSLLSFKSQKLEFRESGFKAMSWNYNSWDQNWRQSQWKSDDQWNEDKSNASSAWDWQQPKRLSEADWSTSTPMWVLQ